MSGLELGFLQCNETPPASLILETGISDRWRLASLPNPERLAEGRSFEQRKANAQGVHFLAIQSSPTVEAFSGFWLLQERSWS